MSNSVKTVSIPSGISISRAIRLSACFGACFLLLATFADAQNVGMTVRLANPEYDCVAQTYCVDVEFQSNTADQQLFGMNVRFFYDTLGEMRDARE